MVNIQDKIRAYFSAHRDEMIGLWETIVNIDSGSYNKSGVDKVLSVLKDVMDHSGIDTKIIEYENAGNMLIGQWGLGNEEPIIFIGHMDTVFKEGTVSERPFTIKENFAYGAGVLDMKAGLVMAIYIVKALQSIGYSERPIKLLFAGDEENIHMNSNARNDLYEECKGGFVAFNFETGYMDDGIVLGRRGAEIFSIEVEGVQAHSGNNPKEGISALEEMAYKIIDIQKLNDIENNKLVNMAVISAAESENIIPGKCIARGSFRFPTVDIQEELAKGVKGIVGKSYLEGTSSKYATKTIIDCMEANEKNHTLFEFIKGTSEEIHYNGKIHPISVGGASDSAVASRAGIPVVCGLGPRGEWNHSPNEYADIESLFDRSIWITYSITKLKDIKI